MHNQKNYNIYSFEPEEEKSRRLTNTIVSQLTSFTFNMLSFDMASRYIKEIIHNFGKYYDIGDDKTNELLENLEEYVKINTNKSNEEFINTITEDKTKVESIDISQNEIVESQEKPESEIDIPDITSQEDIKENEDIKDTDDNNIN